MFKTLSAPTLIQWELTPSCNHNCLHCYNYWRTGTPLPILPKNYESMFASTVKQIIDSKIFVVVVTGGEPLMVIRQAVPSIKTLSDAGIRVAMNTNLTLLTPKKAQLLKDCGVATILTSLPTADPKTCDYITNSTNAVKRTVRGIKLAKSFGLPVSVNMVVSKVNLGQIEQTAELITSLGLSRLNITRASNPAKDSGFESQVLNLNEFRQMLEIRDQIEEKFGISTDMLEANPACAFGEEHFSKVHRFCGAGRNTCTIGHDGEIRPCNRLSMSYGNIMDGLTNAWLAMNDCRSGEWLPKECEPCKLRERCGGGCKADALTAHGSLNRPDPLCDLQFINSDLPRKKITPIEEDTFFVNPKLQIRPEEFGAIAYIAADNWLPVDHDLTKLLSTRQKMIQLSQLESALLADESEARMTASFLVRNKILTPDL